jgi:hypothetical protein
MPILIKDMEMPGNCGPCPFSTLGMDCIIAKQSVHMAWLERRRPDWCPLIEVKRPKYDAKLLRDCGMEE